ncbi:hypothetical protein MHW47_07740 [Streptomyces sp. OfavH-34-F]|uniref:hypothetical protein n=1 Tax=Streptomyces sp. OfavH-34-F TaxID=2917760 RepID=UPI001EF1EFAD|nr:hypothetical protein [Streptomyces sp. OfavH-34-F]MCG7524330.1 hypothetical protein [Streptomyces sp. OfavH-34-F]
MSEGQGIGDHGLYEDASGRRMGRIGGFGHGWVKTWHEAVTSPWSEGIQAIAVTVTVEGTTDLPEGG